MNAAFSTQSVLYQTAEVRDRLIVPGGANGSCAHTLRLNEVHFGSAWYSYLTSVLDPAILPANMAADLYRRRWRMEEAFQACTTLPKHISEAKQHAPSNTWLRPKTSTWAWSNGFATSSCPLTLFQQL